MRLNEVTYSDALPVDGYGPGFFRVGGEVHEGGLLILPSGVSPWAGYGETKALIAAVGTVDVVLLGTGEEIAHPPAEFRAALEGAGLGLDAMASAQACRTYNVLLGEGRRIGLAALPV